MKNVLLVVKIEINYKIVNVIMVFMNIKKVNNVFSVLVNVKNVNLINNKIKLFVWLVMLIKLIEINNYHVTVMIVTMKIFNL